MGFDVFDVLDGIMTENDWFNWSFTMFSLTRDLIELIACCGIGEIRRLGDGERWSPAFIEYLEWEFNLNYFGILKI